MNTSYEIRPDGKLHIHSDEWHDFAEKYDIDIGTICVLIVGYDEDERCMSIWFHEI